MISDKTIGQIVKSTTLGDVEAFLKMHEVLIAEVQAQHVSGMYYLAAIYRMGVACGARRERNRRTPKC